MMGSQTIYPKASDGCSKMSEKDLVIHKGSWKGPGGTSYPDKNHQHQSNHKHREEKYAGGSGSSSPNSYPTKDHSGKFGSVKKTG